MKKILVFILLTFILSCKKKTEVSGIVYSKHNLPVPNVEVDCRYYKESSYPETDVAQVKTNEKGEYRIEFRGKEKLKHEIKCFCDSGYKTESIRIGKANNINLYLE